MGMGIHPSATGSTTWSDMDDDTAVARGDHCIVELVVRCDNLQASHRSPVTFSQSMSN